MPRPKDTAVKVAVIGVVGTLMVAVIGHWRSFFPGDASQVEPSVKAHPVSGPVTQTASGTNDVLINGSNNIVNPAPAARACRDRSHGVERYQRTFDVDRTSSWMSGGYGQLAWCDQVTNELRGQNPDAMVEVVSHSENSHTKLKGRCPPFNCPEYQYFCKVRVHADPLYVEKISSACK